MKSRHCIFASLVALVLLSSAEGAIVRGKVMDASSGTPVGEAYVEIFYFVEAESIFVATGFADTAGDYRFEGVPPGVYFANSWSPWYATTRLYNVTVPEDGLKLDIVLFPPTAEPGGVIIGTDSTTVPHALMIWKLKTDGHNYSISSDAQGRFSLVGLPNGGYLVDVTAAGYQPCQFSTLIEGSVCSYGVILVPEGPTEVEEDPRIGPPDYTLDNAYPNPFNPATKIRFYLPVERNVHLEIADITGRVVAVLVAGVEPAGLHTVEWNGQNASSGIYFCTLRAVNAAGPPEVQVRKLILAR